AWLLGGGEVLTLLSTFVFAVLILLLDRWGRTVQSAHLTVPFVLATGLPALALTLVYPGEGGHAAWLSWFGDMLRAPGVFGAVLLLTLLSTVGATLLMSTYQPQLPAARAGLIYFLEPVFAAGFSVACGYAALAARRFLGV